MVVGRKSNKVSVREREFAKAGNPNIRLVSDEPKPKLAAANQVGALPVF
jgi:hypothetical protein